MIKDKTPLHVLVIEDNMGDFLLINDYLDEQFDSFQVTHCKRFSEAKSFLEAGKEIPDVVLLDLTLPDNQGEKLILDITSLCPESPVIVLTGFSDFEFGVKSLTLKASDYLLKDDINSTSLYKSIKYNIERKKTNLLLEESEKKYSNLFQLSPQPMWILETNQFNFVQVNKAAIDHYGYSEDEFLRMNITNLIAEQSLGSNPMEAMRELQKKKETFKGRFKQYKKNRELIEVDIYSSSIYVNDIPFESIIAIDVTEKNQFELKVTKAIIKTQEDERYDIGSELHDNVCQILASSQLSMQMLRDDLPPNALQWYEKSNQMIAKALEEIRNISHRLAPSFFDYNALEDMFTELLNNFNLQKQYKTTLHISEEVASFEIGNDLRLNLYRITQEQLRNIFKYANAKHVSVDLHADEDNLIITINDDGVGFDIHEVKKGIGLSNMRRRAELFSGKMEITSSKGNGCSMAIKIPITSMLD
jgi:PAS domain S-box-containing protein